MAESRDFCWLVNIESSLLNVFFLFTMIRKTERLTSLSNISKMAGYE